MHPLLEKFRSKIEAGQAVIGPFMKTGDPAFVEVAGRAGFDFAILDMEHGPTSLQNLQNLIRAAEVGCVLPVVRVPEAREIHIGQVLDVGALGVQVPQIQSAQEAEEVIRAARFHPKGFRGVCRFVRAAGYSATDRFEYFKSADDNLVILQLEGREAIENLDAILEVEGADILFIGPYDLSQSLGVPGQVTHPKVVGEMQKIVERAKAKQRVIGTFTDTPETAKMWKDAGVQYVSYSVDVGIFLEACRGIISGFSV
ncbi:aldolase [bacterium]|nr:aldolase [bacterium]